MDIHGRYPYHWIYVAEHVITAAWEAQLCANDDLRSPDYDWCQWFGHQLDHIVRSQDGQVHGFRYPSRRHPGFLAYAMSSRVMEGLTCHLKCSTTRFGDTDALKSMEQDPCCVQYP